MLKHGALNKTNTVSWNCYVKVISMHTQHVNIIKPKHRMMRMLFFCVLFVKVKQRTLDTCANEHMHMRKTSPNYRVSCVRHFVFLPKTQQKKKQIFRPKNRYFVWRRSKVMHRHNSPFIRSNNGFDDWWCSCSFLKRNLLFLILSFPHFFLGLTCILYRIRYEITLPQERITGLLDMVCMHFESLRYSGIQCILCSRFLHSFLSPTRLHNS